MQALFNRLLKTQNNKEVTVQLIQSANILAHNLTRPESKWYLLATSFYSDIVSHPFDFADEEIVENYMSLLKGLTVNLTEDMLRNFLREQNYSLYTGALMFINYSDTMVRTASRTVILNIIKIKDREIRDFILNSGLFLNLVIFTRDQWFYINKALMEFSSSSKIDSLLTEQVDNLYYLNDIFNQDIPEYSQDLGNTFLRFLALPMIVGTLSAEVSKPHHIYIPLATYFLVHVLGILKHPPVINTLVSCLFLKEIRQELLEACLGQFPYPPNSQDHKPPKQFDLIKLGALMVDYLEKLDEPENMTKNPIRNSVLSFLRSRDDNLITLSLLVIDNVVWNNNIGNMVLWKSGLLPQNRMKKKKLLGSIIKDKNDDLEELKDPNKAVYDSEIVENLLRLLNVDPPFRAVTCQLLLKLVLGFSYIENSPRSLLIEHEFFLNTAFKRNILKLRNFLSQNYYDDLFLEYFEEEFKKVSKINFTEKIACYSHLIYPVIENNLAQIPLDQRQPVSELESIRLEIKLFFLLRKAKYLLCQEEIPPNYNINTYPLTYLKSECDWKQDQTYLMGEERQFVMCNMKLGKENFVRFLTEDEDYFVLVEPDQYRLNYATVRTITKLRNVEVMADRADPRSLVIAIKKNQDSYQVVLTFEDSQRCVWAKRKIEENRKVSKSNDISLIESLLDSLDINCKVS